MSVALLDANVLIALTVAEHEHHELAADWLADVPAFAICPIVEGALVRFLVRVGEQASTAQAVLRELVVHPKCSSWHDDVSFAAVDLTVVRGYRQVTDAYLVGLAATHGGVLATLDGALARAYPERVLLLRF